MAQTPLHSPFFLQGWWGGFHLDPSFASPLLREARGRLGLGKVSNTARKLR